MLLPPFVHALRVKCLRGDGYRTETKWSKFFHTFYILMQYRTLYIPTIHMKFWRLLLCTNQLPSHFFHIHFHKSIRLVHKHANTT